MSQRKINVLFSQLFGDISPRIQHHVTSVQLHLCVANSAPPCKNMTVSLNYFSIYKLITFLLIVLLRDDNFIDISWLWNCVF